MEFKCNDCNYVAKDNSALCHHKKTKKHINNVKNNMDSLNAINYLIKDNNLKIMIIEIINKEKDENNILKEKINNLENEIKQLKKSSSKQVNNYIVNNKVNNTVNIGNAQTFLTQNFPDAPALTSSKTHKFIEYDKKNCEEVLWNYEKELHIKYISDILKSEYNKENPEDQALWSSDVSRQSYVIKEQFKNNNNSRWTVDKEGLKTGDTIITPMLQNLRQQINEYSEKIGKKINKLKNGSTNEYISLSKQQALCADFVTEIDDGKMEREIIKYMAPHFNIDKLKLKVDKKLKLNCCDEEIDNIEINYDTDAD
jgi:hypothetical protein